MTKLEELQDKPREKRTPLEQCIVDAATFEEAEHDGEIELMEKAADQLAELELCKKLNDVIMCAYCGHESSKADTMAIINHTLTCDKRPEKKLLEKAFEIEDGLFKMILHLMQSAYSPDHCEACAEIRNRMEMWQSINEKSDEP